MLVLWLGAVAVLGRGLLPLLLGTLAVDHRLSAAGIGLAAVAEGISLSLVLLVAGALFKPVHLRAIVVVAAIILVATDLAAIWARDQNELLVARATAGVPEGVLAWITGCMIARTKTPERWSGAYSILFTLVQIVSSAALTGYVIPHFGANGGFVLLAFVGSLAVVVVPWIPNRLPTLAAAAGFAGIPSIGGLFALLAIILFIASEWAIFVYLVPLARLAGLSHLVAGTAITALLCTKLIGGTLATVIANRLHYVKVLIAAGVAYVIIFPIFAFSAPAWLFTAATMATGLVCYFSMPYLYPLAVEADPSRRAAVLISAAETLGGVLSTLVASWVVGATGTRSIIYVSFGALIASLTIIATLHWSARRRRLALSAVPIPITN